MNPPCSALTCITMANSGAQDLGENPMKNLILDALIRLQRDEKGQGLVEYLLILALVAFAATAGMGSLASGLNSAFSQVGMIIGQYIT
jgi:pilus assembly protein Flp/PilA